MTVINTPDTEPTEVEKIVNEHLIDKSLDTFDEKHVRWVFSDRDYELLLAHIHTCEEIIFDLETTGLDEHAMYLGPTNGGVPARVVLASYTLPQYSDRHGEPTTWLMPLYHPDSPWQGCWQEKFTEIMDLVKLVKKPIINHNIAFDARWTYALTGVDITANIAWDTMVSSHLLDENTSNKLKEVVPELFHITRWDDVDLKYPGAALDVELWALGYYAARDTYWVWKLYHQHKTMLFIDIDEEPIGPEEIENARLGKLATWVSMPTVRSLTKIQLNGMRMDREWVLNEVEHCERVRDEAFGKMVDLYPELYQAQDQALTEEKVTVSEDGTISFSMDAVQTVEPLRREDASFAPTSRWFLRWSEAAVEHGDLRVTAYTGTGKPQWSKSVLAKQARQGSEVAANLLSFRDAVKRLEFLNSWLTLQAPDGRVYPTYHSARVATGRISSSNPNAQQCVKGSTEVLTRNGFIRIEDLTEGVEILQSDAYGRSSWVVPELVSYQFKGEGVVMSSSNLKELWTTPDHRVLTHTRDGAPMVEEASYFLNKWPGTTIIDRKIIRGTRVTGGRVLDEKERRLLELAIAAQADGSFERGKTDRLVILVTRPRKQERLKVIHFGQITENFVEKRGCRMTRAVVNYHEISEWMDETKNFRMEKITELCEEDLRFFMECIMRWDGDFTRGNTYKQAEKRRQSVEVVQVAAALSGYSTTRYSHRVTGSDYPTVNVKDKAIRHMSRTTIRSEFYEGPVYCVTVPDSFFLIRTEGGTPVVTGNCTARLKPAFLPDEGNVWVNLDFSQIELRVAAFIAGCEDMKRAYREGRDLHIANACLATPDEAIKSAGRYLCSIGLPPTKAGSEVLQVLYAKQHGHRIEAAVVKLCEPLWRKFGNAPDEMVTAAVETLLGGAERPQGALLDGMGADEKRELVKRLVLDYRRTGWPWETGATTGTKDPAPTMWETADRATGVPSGVEEGREAWQVDLDDAIDTLSTSKAKVLNAVTGADWAKLRQSGKAVGFGYVYGMGAEGFQAYADVSYGVSMTIEQAEATRANFFRRYHELETWHRTTAARIIRTAQSVSPLGRVRRLPEAHYGDPKKVGEAERAGINSPVQSMASDMMQMAAASIQGFLPGVEAVPGAKVVGTVHDSIMLEVPEDRAEEIGKECQRRMETISEEVARRFGVVLDVPIKADGELETRWGLHDVKEF